MKLIKKLILYSTFRRCTQKCYLFSLYGSSFKINSSFEKQLWTNRQINSTSVHICGMSIEIM